MVDPVPTDAAKPEIQSVTLHPLQQLSLEKAHLHDVRLLLDSMVDREESTVKLILGHLYDIGSVNLINQKLHSRSLNRLAKWLAVRSKPVFRMIAFRWFKRNCPRLITEWLHSQVKFEPKAIAQVVEMAETAALPAATQELQVSAKQLEVYRREVRLLHSRIKLLTTLLISVTCALGSGLAWLAWREQIQPYQSQRITPIEFVEQSTHCMTISAQPCH